MAIVIQLRRGTASGWTSSNPILALGEAGIETDTRKWKVGDGTSHWNDLDYMLGGDGGPSGADVKSGYTTLASGEAVVTAGWTTNDTIVVALRQAAPATAGKQLYCDPADHVAGISFKIKSEDATDAGLVFWMAMEPTDNPVLESGMVLKADASVDNAFIYKDLGSANDEVWLTFDLAYAQAALDFWQLQPFGSAVIGSLMSADGLGGDIEAPFVQYNTPDFVFADGGIGGEQGGTPAVAETWQTLELHYKRADAVNELYVNGVLAYTHTHSPDSALDIRNILLGQYFAYGDVAEVVYIKNVKCGSSRGGTQFFAENFDSDLSAWDVTGDCTIVADPY
jgi:hypothetical protein